MPDQIYIGNFGKGQKTDRTAFNIDNDAFPTLYNAFSWRGRAKRKRGTAFLGQLEIQVEMTFTPTEPWQYGNGALTNDSINLFTFLGISSSQGASITPGSINLFLGPNATTTITEPNPPDGTLLDNGSTNGTINYATGVVNIPGGGGNPVTGTFSYFPGLPVMGLPDFDVNSSEITSPTSSDLYPVLLAFDTQNSYQINQAVVPPTFYNTTFYKDTEVPFEWSGEDFQLFWTTNYSGALWATNNVPGFNFVSGTYISGSGTTTITFNFKSKSSNFTNLIDGDLLFFNEWNTGGSTINGLIGTVTTNTGAASGNYIVTFSGNQVVAGTGIAQLLTNTIPGQDGIKWYDGDPTATTGLPTDSGLGWVNFSPPLTATSVSIDNTPSNLYYLVGALAILPFKDRLLFFSPWIQTSSGSPIQLIDTVLWSWNGTPYYTTPVPTNQTENVKAYYVDQTGLGGYLPAGISQPIKTVANNEDVLIIGFGGDGRKTRLTSTGNDLQPFLFFNINSELPSSSTFSAVVLDKGAIDIGQYGIAMTDQQSSQRIDLDIPDSVFQIQSLNNGADRVNAIRDFFREWIYFSYPVNGSISPFGTNNSKWKFPTQTFLFNYRDNTWAILYENFTVHGYYRPQFKKTWQNLPFKSWNEWREPWNSGSGGGLSTLVIAGNPQGYVLTVGEEGTTESISGSIQSLTNSGGSTQITSINHCVSLNDFLLISGALGTTSINGLIGKVVSTPDANNFVVDINFPSGTYSGLGKYTRLSQPMIQTKQFGAYWNEGRKVRLGVQKYLFDVTQNAQVTVNINLSQDANDAWNDPFINSHPNSLEYSQVVYTCPESTNLGLTPANTNLQMPTAAQQSQIWHRMNTSLIGDSVQLGITLNEAQMKNLTYATAEIALHGIQLTLERSSQLA